MTEEVRYVLLVPFEYALRGQLTRAQFVLLRAPSSKQYRECAALKQAFFRAVPREVQKETGPGEQSAEITASDVVSIIAASRDVSYEEVLDAARRLLTSGVAQVDGETKLTVPMLDNVGLEDLELMMGQYLVSFTLASTLAAAKTRS